MAGRPQGRVGRGVHPKSHRSREEQRGGCRTRQGQDKARGMAVSRAAAEDKADRGKAWKQQEASAKAGRREES